MMNNPPRTNPTPRNWSGRHSVAALFSNRDAAERAIMDLKNAGFSGGDIGIAMRDRNAQGELVKDTGTHAAEGAVSGAGIGAATAGIVGALVGLGIPDEEAHYFERGFNEGGVLVTVKTDTRLAEAVNILERNGGDTAANPSAVTYGHTTSDNWTVDSHGNQVPRSNI